SNQMIIIRPAFSILLAVNFIYQLPLVLLSEQFRLTLEEYWYWSFLINFTACVLLSYVYLTRNQCQGSIGDMATHSKGDWFSLKYISPLAVLLLIFSVAYIEAVQFKCTGLYALVADPSMTLLAREFGIKI